MSKQFFQAHADSPDSVTSAIQEERWKAGKEIFLSWLCVTFTLFAVGMATWEQYPVFIAQLEQRQWAQLAGHSGFLLIVCFLIYGSLVYQSTRLGYLKRLRRQADIPPQALNHTYRRSADKALSILVPSYKEERRVIFQTLLSAALQEHPNRRVTLLLDDPPKPNTAGDAAHLAEARELPAHIMAMLQRPAFMFNSSIKTFRARRQRARMNGKAETRLLVTLWQEAADWFEAQASAYDITDHTDRLFVEKIFVDRAAQHQARSAQLKQLLEAEASLSEEQIVDDYQRLACLFSCDITSFERKR